MEWKNMNQPIGTAVIVLNDKNQILLGKRKNSFRAGWYGLPGGRMNKGEKLVAGAKRELREETNLIAQDVEYVAVVKEWQKDENHDFVHFIFLCKDWTGELELLEPDKCEGWEWFELSNLPENVLLGHLAGIRVLKNKEKVSWKDV